MRTPQEELLEAETTAAGINAVLAAHPDVEAVDGEWRAKSLRAAMCNDHDVFVREYGAELIPVLCMRREFRGSRAVRMPPVKLDALLYEMLCGEDREAAAAVCRTVEKILAEQER